MLRRRTFPFVGATVLKQVDTSSVHIAVAGTTAVTVVTVVVVVGLGLDALVTGVVVHHRRSREVMALVVPV